MYVRLDSEDKDGTGSLGSGRAGGCHSEQWSAFTALLQHIPIPPTHLCLPVNNTWAPALVTVKSTAQARRWILYDSRNPLKHTRTHKHTQHGTHCQAAAPFFCLLSALSIKRIISVLNLAPLKPLYYIMNIYGGNNII